MEFLSKPWAWYVAGPMISFVMFMMLYFGKNFGVSANLRTLCTIGGADKFSDFFRFDWKSQIWNLVFVAGSVTGGAVASQFLMADNNIALSPDVISHLKSIGVSDAGEGFLPESLFSFNALMSLRGIVILIGGGFLVGFGARYAGGCTSGHAISGISDLQIPSMIAVVGFFIGGLIMTYFLLPLILNL